MQPFFHSQLLIGWFAPRPRQIGYKLKHSGAKVIIMEDENKYMKVAEAVKECPNVEAVCRPSLQAYTPSLHSLSSPPVGCS
jgi:long-subunit acyl-CoA synthetase (AMP-forming)